MKPKNKRMIKYILWSMLFAIVISILWIIRPCNSYDKSKIDKRLTSLEEPFKLVGTSCYLDGGSVAIKIIDKNDIILKIAFPVTGFDPSYEQIYFGAYHIDHLKEGDVEIENPLETKLMLQDILHRYSNRDPHLHLALCTIRGRVVDHIKVAYHSKNGHCNVVE